MTPSFSRRVPRGDTLERNVCDTCGYVAYENPKIVAGAVVHFGSRILLCKRNIEPAKGRWTLPAGYLENGESPEEGAMREAFEEATAKIRIDSLLAVYTIRRLSQVQLIYRAHLTEPEFAPGPESQAVALFEPDEIPHEDLAFTTVRWALSHAALPGGPFANPQMMEPRGPE